MGSIMKEGEKVDLIIGKESPLGFAVLINEEVEGLLYKNEIFQDVSEGMSIIGYIKKIREDNKIDVSLTPQGFKKNIDTNTKTILDALEANNGVLYLTDKSSPQEVKDALKMSKKNFKRALGNLYKQKKISLTDQAIVLSKKKG